MKLATKFIAALYRAFEEADCSLAEINPLVLTEQGDVLAVDAKITLDDNALFRHSTLAELRDIHEEDPLEVESTDFGLNYVKLDGNVGCMVNGAGLAMATMDIVKVYGGEPANFRDVGGLSAAAHPDAPEGVFFIYDGYEGGIGIATLAFEAAERHLDATLDLVAACPCRTGCPSCVQSPKCGNFNEPLDKDGAIRLLRRVFDR